MTTEFSKTFTVEPVPEKRYLLHNRTPQQIRIVKDSYGEVLLPPLAQRVISGPRLAPFEGELTLLRQRHQLRVREYHQPHGGFRLAAAAIWLAATVLVVIMIHDVLKDGTLERLEVGISAAVVAVLILAVLGISTVAEWNRRKVEVVADTEEGDIEFGMGGAFYDGNETVRRTKHIITLLTVITIGAVMPAIAIFVATDAKDFLVMDGGLHVVDGKESRLVGRLIQVLYTATLSLFPAILYFQFDRHRVGTIRSEWVRSIFRMDKRMETLADVNARYGDELAEASSYSTDSVRILGGRNSPIVVATLLITLGWILLVVQTDSFDFSGSSEITALAQSADQAADRANAALDDVEQGRVDPAVGAATARSARDEAESASQEATVVADGSLDGVGSPPAAAEPTSADTVDEDADGVGPEAAAEAAAASAASAAELAASAEARVDQPFFQFIVPTPSAAAMAFLGAYFFGAYLILRSYFRGDLRPKIYSQITARLITVVVLAYLIQTLFSEFENGFVWALSFLAGVVPTTVLQRLGHLVSSVGAGPTTTPNGDRRWIRRAFTDAFGTPRALTQLDGVDLHDSTRLETEGINDVPSLAKSDLVSVMVNTRLPVDRLVDWMDQAVLILLLDDGANEDLDDRVTRLRRIGLRTASGVLDVSGGKPGEPRYDAADRIIASRRGNKGDATSLAGLAADIRREPAMVRILEWYGPDYAAVDQPCPTILVKHGVPVEATPPTNGDHPATDVAAPVFRTDSHAPNGGATRHADGGGRASAIVIVDEVEGDDAGPRPEHRNDHDDPADDSADDAE